MSKVEKQGSLLGGSLLITGTCIGAGMIGLPVVSAAAGFIPSFLAMVLCYFFATTTGLFLMEAALWFQEKVHLISIARFALGAAGKWIAWIFFLFLFYCLFVAYLDGGGQLLSNLMAALFERPIPREGGIFATVIIVGCFVYIGTRAVSYVSRVFLLGLAVSYASLAALGLPHVEGARLLQQNWKAAAMTIPILFICFGYQNVVPTVLYYLKRNVNLVRKAIFIGTAIPFVIYAVWNFVILGILPGDPKSYEKIVHHGDLVTGLLQKASESSSVLFFANAFSIFAVLTPFMASTLAFVDFFKDGLKKFPKVQFDPIIYGLVLIPPTVCTLLYPNLFLAALGFAGGFIDAVLFGVLPCLIVWIGRYRRNREGPYTVPGGKPLLLAVLVFSLAVLIYRLSGMFP